MEEKRKELHKAINLYGLLDERVLAISQELDLLIVAEQKKETLEKVPTIELRNCTSVTPL